MDDTVIFFSKPWEFNLWLADNHDKLSYQWIGFYKKGSGLVSITWPESVDEALCYGWIDGLRKSIDETSYKIRFTPRKPTSHWSDVNIKRVTELTDQGKMQPTGIAAFKKRKEERSRKASYEQTSVEFRKSYETKLQQNQNASKFFQSRPPSYQKQCIWWVMSAKKEETRVKRLNILISSSEKEEKIPPLKWSK